MRKTLLTTTLVGMLVLSASACSPSSPPSVSAPKEVDAPALNATQVRNVVAKVQETLAKADQKKDKKLLAQRVYGTALNVRSAQYDASKNGAPPALDMAPSAITVSKSKEWPRAVLDQAINEKSAAIFLLRQEDARANYKLYSWVRLFPGVTVPETMGANKGSVLLPTDTKDLAIAPKDLAGEYSKVVVNPKDGAAKKYEADPYAAAVRKDLEELRHQIGENGQANVSLSAAPEVEPMAVSLPNGGALVALSLKQQTDVKVTKARGSIKFEGRVADLLGGEGKVPGAANWTTSVMALFVVPPKGSKDKIQAIGADFAIVAATRDDGAAPQAGDR